jgi:hypothetical protein
MVTVAIFSVILGAGMAAYRLRRLHIHYHARAAAFSAWETMEREAYQAAVLREKHERLTADESVCSADEYDRLAENLPRFTLSFSLGTREYRDPGQDGYRRLASEARWEARRLRIMANQHRADAAWAERRTVAFARLKTKYERAARYPWLPVEADPPEPGPGPK